MNIATTGTYFSDRAVSRLAVSVASVAYLAGYLGYGFREQLDPARYFVYAIPGILVGSLLLQSTPKINEPAAGYVISYLTLTFVACLAGIVDTWFFWNDVIIMTLIGLCFVPSIYVGADQIRTIFLGSLVCFLLKWVLTDHSGIRILELLAAGDSVDEVLEAFPSLRREQVLACVDHAARLMGNQYSFEPVA